MTTRREGTDIACSSAAASHLRPPRMVAACIVLTVAVAHLGLPSRPTLPVGAVDSTAMTAFLVASLRLIITVSTWYLLVALVVVGLAALPGPTTVLRPLADRMLGAGMGIVLRRLVASSVAVGVLLPSTASGEAAGAAGDEIPVMVPLDENRPGAHAEASSTRDRPVGPSEPVGPSVDPAEAESPDMQPRGPTRTTVVERSETADTGNADSRSTVAEMPTDSPRMHRRPGGAETVADADTRLVHDDPPTMRRRPGTAPPRVPTGAEGDRAASADERPGTTGRPDPSRVVPARHTVQRGESFWTIAEGMVQGRPGPADTAAVAAVWQQLVDLNAEHLVDPGNPDLLHTGQVIDLGVLI